MNNTTAPNLTQRPPHSPRVRLAGYAILSRILDKGPAELAAGQGDGEILTWVQEHAPPQRAPLEIQQWSAYYNERGPDGDVETLEFLTSRVGSLRESREDVKTWFDYLDLDDHVTFGGKA